MTRSPQPTAAPIVWMAGHWGLGGAQMGLVRLLENGLADGREVTLIGAVPAAGHVLDRLPPLLRARIRLVDCGPPRRVMTYLRMLKQSYRAGTPDSLMFHSLFAAVILGRLLKLLGRGRRHVALGHMPLAFEPPWQRRLLALTAPLCDHVACDSEAVAASYRPLCQHHGIPCSILPLVGLPTRPPARIPRFDMEAPVKLLTVGRLVAEKNHTLLLDEAARLRDHGLPFHLTIVGDGPLRAPLLAQRRQLGLESQVDLPGATADPDALLAQNVIYLQTSLVEGQCLTLVEALSHGRPAVVAPVGGIRDYTRDGENCLWFDPQQPGSLAAAVQRLTADPALCAHLSRGALETVSQFFGTAKQRQALEALLQRLSADAGPAS
ncbi:MAG: glycosyltransferase family 4 protein [Magnetococcus sp. WYHC-3]